MAAYRPMTMYTILLFVLHMSPTILGVTMDIGDRVALTVMREAIENKENYPPIECSLNYLDPFQCDTSGNVYFVYLDGLGLKGTIAPEIGNLTRLTHLIIVDNQLTGSIPWTIGKLTSLQILYLFNNNLTGPIPSSIGKLTSLQQLSLSSNQLSGSIPSSIGNMTILQRLALSVNLLSGSIPSSIFNLTSLRSLYLFRNQLTGSIPSSIVNLISVEYIEISNNYFIGPIAKFHGLPSCPALGANCLFGSSLPSGCAPTDQRSTKACQLFCNATQVGGPCGGNGVCSNSTDGTTRACACYFGYSDEAVKHTCKPSFPPFFGRETALTPQTHRSPPPLRPVSTPPSPKRRPLSPHLKPPLRALHSPPPRRPPPLSPPRKL